MRACANCGVGLTSRYQKKFCSSSCSAAVNNIGVTRHGEAGRFQEKSCPTCGKQHRKPKYCSRTCCHAGLKKTDEETLERRRLKNLLGVRRYQARLYGQTPDDADRNLIKKIYESCPDGHEVDHVIPISRGGYHHQDNLQYLPWLDNRRKGNKLPSEFGPVTGAAIGADS